MRVNELNSWPEDRERLNKKELLINCGKMVKKENSGLGKKVWLVFNAFNHNIKK